MTIRSIIQHSKLPLLLLVAFLITSMWVLFGRIFFGAFGWMVFVLLFTVVPVIVIYGIVLTIVVAVRQRTVIFARSGRFMNSVYITLAALFVFGLAIPDGGDSKDSAGSALTVLMGDKSDLGALAFSGTIATFSLAVAFVAAVMALILVFFERTKRPVASATHDVA